MVSPVQQPTLINSMTLELQQSRFEQPNKVLTVPESSLHHTTRGLFQRRSARPKTTFRNVVQTDRSLRTLRITWRSLWAVPHRTDTQTIIM